jgi:uncharacterized protein (DUF488 family)
MNDRLPLFTIGFTQKTAETFFEMLRKVSAKRVIDVRLNNVSQLAGFSKRDDLGYFLRSILGIEYLEEPLLAPTQEMLHAYKKGKGAWPEYEEAYRSLIARREVEKRLDPGLMEGACHLCSEASPCRCHRTVAAEYLREKWGGFQIRHL